MTNREAALELLHREHELAGEGKRCVLIGGEPGIGKTRLVSEFATAAHAGGSSVLFGRASEGMATPYLPFVEAIEHLLANTPASALAPVQHQIARLGWIVPAARAHSQIAERPEVAAGPDQFVLFAAVLALLEAASLEAPVIVALDDLHWADEGTLLLLEYLLAGQGEFRALIVATYRDTEAAPEDPLGRCLAQLARAPNVARVELSGLSGAETLNMLTDIAGHGPRSSETELAGTLQRETNGNPLFVSELMRSLIESGAVSEGEGRWHLRDDLSAIRPPPTVTDVIAQRVLALDPEVREALEVASVIGREFDPELVEQVIGADAQGMADAWDEAERAAIVRSEGALLSFTHPLVGRAIRDGLGSRRRGALHRRIAEALEARDRAPEATELARHWIAAAPADPARARAAAAGAGADALGHFDGSAAAEWYGRALELAAGDRSAGDRERCESLLGLGVAQRQRGDSSFRQTLLEAARLAQALGDSELLVEAALSNTRGFSSASGEVDTERVAMLEAALSQVGAADGRERALLLARLAIELTFSGQWERRVELSDEALAIARRLDDRATLAQVLIERFVTIWMPETLDERLANTEEAVGHADALGDPWLQFHAAHWRSVGLLQSGALAEAAAVAARQDELAATIADPTMRWISAYDQANFAIIAGRLDAAEALAESAVAIANDAGQPDAIPFFANQLTNIRFEQGRLSELQPLIAEVVADNPGIPGFRAVLALAYVEGELHDEARNLLATELESDFSEIPRDVTWLAAHSIYAHVAAELADRPAAELLLSLLAACSGQIAYTGISAWGDVDHALGRLATVLGRFDEAEQHLRASAERYRRIEAPVWLARCELDTARMRIARDEPGDREAAAALLDRAHAAARRLGAATIERRARSLREHVRAMEVSAAAGASGQRLRRRAAAPTAAHPASDTAALERAGDYWVARFGGRETRLRHSKGVAYLAQLLAYPGVEAHAADLQAGPAARPADAPRDREAALSPQAAGGGDAGALLDDAAKREYRERIEALEAEIEEAERFNDPERAANSREELEFLGRELARAVGVGGRDRPAASESERARVNVTRALRHAIERIASYDEELGSHLELFVRTGTFCCYEPAAGHAVRWDVRAGGG